MQLSLYEQLTENTASPQEKTGAVYTRPWVVELILDLAGYRFTEDLVSTIAVEPAAGRGAFLLPMIRRLLDSWRLHEQPISALADCLRAYEVNPATAAELTHTVEAELVAAGLADQDAARLAATWVINADFLLAPHSHAGADFVVGNPPYIRYDDLPEGLLATYKTMYSTMKGRADIYIAFFQAALSQLAEQGVCAFICADRWMLNAYGAELRRFITRSFGVEAVIEMHNAPAFEDDVSAYPAIVVVRRAVQGTTIVASVGEQAGPIEGMHLADFLGEVASGTRERHALPGFRATTTDAWFTGDNPWPCVSPERLALLQRLEAHFLPLKDNTTGTKISIGVATGADDVFITTDPAVVEPERLLPLAMASDTKNGHLAWSGHYLIDPWEKDGLVNLDHYPKLAAYFTKHRAALTKRNVASRNPRGWYRTIDRVTHALLRQPKLYFPDMKLTIHPILDEGKTYPHHNLYVLTSTGWDLEVLGGLLLSRVAQFFIECYCVRMRGGTLRFQAQYLRRIRVPSPEAIPADATDGLRAAFRNRDVAQATAIAFRLYSIDELPLEAVHGS